MLEKEFTIHLSSGSTVTATVYVDISTDDNYGADADGNRGTETYSIEYMSFENVTVDDDGVELTNEDKQELKAELMEKAESYAWM